MKTLHPRRPQAAESLRPLVSPVPSRPATTPPHLMAGRREQAQAATTRRRARRAEAGHSRNQGPPTAIAGGRATRKAARWPRGGSHNFFDKKAEIFPHSFHI